MFISCTGGNEVSKYVRTHLGKTIILDKQHYSHDFLIDSIITNSQYVILTPEIPDACSSCYFKLLDTMNSFIESLHMNEVNCISFVRDNYPEYAIYLKEHPLKHTYIIDDPDNSYKIDNGIDDYTTDFCTFLVDCEDMTIKLVGNPISRSKVQSLYKDVLNRIYVW